MRYKRSSASADRSFEDWYYDTWWAPFWPLGLFGLGIGLFYLIAEILIWAGVRVNL